MSFITSALAVGGKHLIQRGAAYLAQRGIPALVSGVSKLGSYLSNSELGRTAGSYLMDKALSLGFDSVRKFANNKTVQNKMPVVTGYSQSAADALQSRLRDKYTEMTAGGPDSGGGDHRNVAQRLEKINGTAPPRY